MLKKIDPPGLLLGVAYTFVCGALLMCGLRAENKPPLLASRAPFAEAIHYAAGLTTDEAQYCRLRRGTPFGGRFCDFGPCAPCQPAGWPCSVRTVVCRAGECSP